MSYLEEIPEKWKLTTIEKETIVVTDYVANGSFASLKENVTYLREVGHARLIRLTDHNNKYQGEGVYVDKHSYDFLNKSKLEPNDIIISNVGEYSGTLFKVPDLKMPMTLGPNSILVKFKDNQDFMYYFLQSRIGQHLIDTVKSGSANPKFNKTEFKKIEFIIPPPKEQKAIANVLTAFDDKIELLQQQNTTLETLAQTIFQEWFGKFQLGDELPEGWRVGKIGDIVEIKRGGSPRPIQDYISNSGYRWLKISDATATNSPYIFEIKEHIKVEGLNKTTLKKAGDLVLSNSATPGIPKFLAVDSCVHDGWMHFSSSKVSNEYLYLLFQYIRPKLVQQGSGSVFVNLKTDILRQFEIVIPTESVFNRFNNLIKPIFDKIYNNAIQIQSLTKTRDTLLPKLMSGQIRVKT